MDLVSGPGHTNLVCSMQATADRLYSLGMDKALKTVEIATNEFRYSACACVCVRACVCACVCVFVFVHACMSCMCMHVEAVASWLLKCHLCFSWLLIPCSGVGLSLTGLDPTGMALTADETVVVATTSEVGYTVLYDMW